VPLLLIWAMVFFQTTKTPLVDADYGIFSIFLAGATACFLLSATFHTLCCHSEVVESFWVRMDFVGIIILTVTTFVAGEYYLFYCEPTRRAVHFTLVSRPVWSKPMLSDNLADHRHRCSHDHCPPDTEVQDSEMAHLPPMLLLRHGSPRLRANDRQPRTLWLGSLCPLLDRLLSRGDATRAVWSLDIRLASAGTLFTWHI